jgi:exodeoxyribonuclease VII small subunit
MTFDQTMTFEEDLLRLEAIAEALQGEGVPLEEALVLFEEGIQRIRHASAELTRADARLAVLIEQSDATFALRPLAE